MIVREFRASNHPRRKDSPDIRDSVRVLTVKLEAETPDEAVNLAKARRELAEALFGSANGRIGGLHITSDLEARAQIERKAERARCAELERDLQESDKED